MLKCLRIVIRAPDGTSIKKLNMQQLLVKKIVVYNATIIAANKVFILSLQESRFGEEAVQVGGNEVLLWRVFGAAAGLSTECCQQDFSEPVQVKTPVLNIYHNYGSAIDFTVLIYYV